MSGWQRFNHRDCPVCNGVRNDCRQSLSTGLIHCRASDADPVDYLFRGEDAWGFGMWVAREEVEAASEEKRREWQQQRELEKQHRLAIEAQRQAIALNLEERDRASQIESLALNLMRLHLFTHQGSDDRVAQHLLRESQFFVEWIVPTLNLETDLNAATELIELQRLLSKWKLNWSAIWSDEVNRQKVAILAQQWGDRLRDHSFNAASSS